MLINNPHDPGVDIARRRAEAALRPPVSRLAIGDSDVRVGIASWTDPTMTAPGVFYPDNVRTPEQRLRYYSSRYPLVEVDSTYYAIPARRMAELWVERTPDDFVFDIKAHALMTGHPSEVSRLPKALREALPRELQGSKRLYPKDLPPEIIDAVWTTFLDALQPLSHAGKLGAIFFQYPRWFVPNRESAAEIERARERLGTVPAAVEFRHNLWLSPRLQARTLDLLRNTGMSYVIVDTPPGMPSSVPPVAGVTNEALAVFRFHGRRTETWEKPTNPVSERYRYLYDQPELAEWVPRIIEVTESTAHTHVVMNNCYGNYGTTNADEMTSMLMTESGHANQS
jgi:uncharacterized protein YecE (DUF72 family)